MAFMESKAFGAIPEGADLQRVLASAHQAGGVFANLEPAPVLTKGGGFISNSIRWLLSNPERTKPVDQIPVLKEDVTALQHDALVWYGHSSFLLRLEGQNLLIDPVLSDYASPISLANRAFAGTSVFSARDFPVIDCLLLTHDHWDHLDYATMLALKGKIKKVVTGLGTGAHLRRWGFERERIVEADWGDAVALSPTLRVHLATSRHFSGRSLSKRDRALWCGFVLESPERRLYISGDGGYGGHFAEIARQYGPVDLALLEQGQYNERWPTVHMFPEEAARVAEEIHASWLLPSHVGRFCISEHAWDDPLKRAVTASEGKSYKLLTPVIGQVIRLDRDLPELPRWWEGLN